MSHMSDVVLLTPPLIILVGTSIVAWFSVRSSRRYKAEAEAERKAHAK